MGCTSCANEQCRQSAKDCFGIKEQSIARYQMADFNEIAKSASALVDNGRAGKLNRLQEIIEYCHLLGYRRIGVAYCYGLATLAASLEKTLKESGLRPIMVQCTAGGVLEQDIDSRKTKQTVSCNPVGQSLVLKKKRAELVIEFGLCLGHDIMLHQSLDIPFTTLLVKDRVFNHNPAKALESYQDTASRLQQQLQNDSRRRDAQWLNEQDMDSITLVQLQSPTNNAWLSKRIHSIPFDKLLEHWPRISKQQEMLVFIGSDLVNCAYAVSYAISQGHNAFFIDLSDYKKKA